MGKKTRQRRPRPTDAELELLQLLWEGGPRTVRQIHDDLPKSTSYTTTLTILQRMAEKGLVHRDESQRSHIYSAAVKAEITQRQLVKHLLKSAFQGSPGRLVMQALAEEPASNEELEEIQRLIKKLQKNNQ